jgi:predicted acetyltransferase
MQPIDGSVTLEPIASERSEVLSNLLQLYVHDFSEHVPVPLKPNGRFEFSLDPTWWNGADHFPFLIHRAGELAGFALARRGSRVNDDANVMDVAEFFVVRGVRRRGVGLAAAHALFARVAGPWEIRVRQSNAAAQRFWSGAVATWLGYEVQSTPFSAKGVDWQLLELDAARTRR